MSLLCHQDKETNYESLLYLHIILPCLFLEKHDISQKGGWASTITSENVLTSVADIGYSFTFKIAK